MKRVADSIAKQLRIKIEAKKGALSPKDLQEIEKERQAYLEKTHRGKFKYH